MSSAQKIYSLRNVDGSISSDASIVPAGTQFQVATHYPESEYPQQRPNGQACYVTHERDGSEPVEDCGRIIYLSASVYAELVDDMSDIHGYQYGLRGKGEDAAPIIQCMLTNMNNSRYSFSGSFTGATYEPNLLHGGSPRIIIPAGRYSWSQEVSIDSAYFEIKAEHALFMPTVDFEASGGVALEITRAWQGSIKGMRMSAFNTAIKIDSFNLDTGKIQIEDCHFTDNDEALVVDAASSIIQIDNSRFLHNKVAWDIASDHSVISNTWVTDNGGREGLHDSPCINRVTAQTNTCHMYVNDCIFTPILWDIDAATEPSWFKNEWALRITNCRFGGESGSMAAVNNFAAADVTYPVTQSGVWMEDCQVTATTGGSGPGASQPAALRLCNNVAPNVIHLTGNHQMVDSNLVDWSPTSSPSPATVFSAMGVTGSIDTVGSVAANTLIYEIHGNKDSEYPYPSWVRINYEHVPAEIAPYVRIYA